VLKQPLVCAMNILVVAIIFYEFFLNKFKKRRSSWHGNCFQNVCQLSDYTQHFIKIIPKHIDSSQKNSPVDFTRIRDLPFHKLDCAFKPDKKLDHDILG
jgi:hypothetical protein